MVSSVTNASKNITRHKRKKPEPIKRIQLFFVVVVDFFYDLCVCVLGVGGGWGGGGSALVTSYRIFSSHKLPHNNQEKDSVSFNGRKPRGLVNCNESVLIYLSYLIYSFMIYDSSLTCKFLDKN